MTPTTISDLISGHLSDVIALICPMPKFGGWIKQAYENLKRDKTMCSKHLRGEINIEEVRPMGTKKLMVDIPEELHDRFFEYVINKFKAKPEPGHKAINTAVEIALADFLERMEKGGDKGNQG